MRKTSSYSTEEMPFFCAFTPYHLVGRTPMLSQVPMLLGDSYRMVLAEGVEPSWSETLSLQRVPNSLLSHNNLIYLRGTSFSLLRLPLLSPVSAWEMLFSPAYLSSDFLTRLKHEVLKGTAVVILFFLFMSRPCSSHKLNKISLQSDLSKQRGKVDAQPLKQMSIHWGCWALHGPFVFTITNMAAVFFLLFISSVKMNRFDWIMLSSLQAIVLVLSFLLPVVTSRLTSVLLNPLICAQWTGLSRRTVICCFKLITML